MRPVEKLKSGRYKVRFRHGLNKAGTGLRETSETFDTHRDAVDFAKALDALGPQGALDRLFNGDQAGSPVPILDEVAAAHIEHMEGAGAGHKVKSQRLWERTWGPRIGAVRADQVTRDILVRALNDLAANGQAVGRGYSAKSLYNQRGLLFGVLNRCVAEGHLTTNPGTKLRIPQVTRALDMDDEDDAAEMICMTLDEVGVLYDAMTPHYRPLFLFLVGTGCRWGEAVALRKSDTALTDRVPAVRIRRALKWSPDGRFTIGPPKTDESRRSVSIAPEIVEDLEILTEGKAPGDLVFTSPRGGMIAHRTFWSDHWRPAIWRAQHCADHTSPECRCGTAHPKRCQVHDAPPPPCGCPGTLTQTPRIHDLRHTHASIQLARGVPIHVVQRRLGHKSIQTTVDRYSHLMPDAQALSAEAASLSFRPAGPLGLH